MGCSSSKSAHDVVVAEPYPHAIYSPPRGLSQALNAFQQPGPTPVGTTQQLFYPQQNATYLAPSNDGVDWANYRELQQYKAQYWIDYDDLSIIRSLPCNYMKTEVGNLNGQPVLIKSFDLSKSPDEIAKSRKSLVSEIKSMARIHHPNIVAFLGFNLSPDHGLVCVSEYMDNQTLRDLLEKPKVASKLSWAVEKIGYAIDICSALAYMHSLKPTLIHRNVKAAKVLLSFEHPRAKLSGFGVSRERSYVQEMTNKIGEIEWSAPELLIDGEDYTEKVDVYSFGMLLTELDTCATPFADEKATMHANDFTNALATGALRPKLSPNCPTVISKVVKYCLQQDPHLRPSSSTVLDMLNDAKADLARQPAQPVP
ncbi:unnamed protein product [Aphanomyces euteiches]|nr:hypothetical protein AeRB84_018731 [Aphanomyces euteiches]